MGWPTKYTGEIMDSTLEKGRQMKTSNNGWIRMESSESKPTDFNNLKNTGNYITEYWTNGPDVLVNSKIKPVNITVNDIGGILYQFLSAREVIFSRQILEDGTTTPWIIDQANGALTRGSSAPANPVDGKTLWLDSSDSNNAILKLYINGEWVEIRSDNIMKKSVYDPQGKETDIYEYIENVINKGNLDAGITDMTDYSKHIQDSSIHITADELEKLKALPITDTLKERTDEIKTGLKTSVETTIGTDRSKYEKVSTDYNELKSAKKVHITDTNIHPTEENIKKWNNKADANHTHNAEDHTVKVSYDKVSGGIPTSVMPYYVKERAYKIESEDELKDITKNPYHSGDVFYKENSVGYENTWHLLANDTAVKDSAGALPAIEETTIPLSFGTTKYWVMDLTKYGNYAYYGVYANNDSATQKTNMFITSSNLDLTKWTDGVPIDTSALDPYYYYSICRYFKGVILLGQDWDLKYYDARQELHDPVSSSYISGSKASLLYTDDKIALSFNNTGASSSLYHYSTDGINWSEGNLPAFGSCSDVCYGNGKYVVLQQAGGTYFYSTDAMNWTQGTIPTTIEEWKYIAYANGMFVYIVNNTSSRCYYSSDAITWTEGTLPYRASWDSICGSDNVFVLMSQDYSEGNFNIVYSYDGITWIDAKDELLGYRAFYPKAYHIEGNKFLLYNFYLKNGNTSDYIWSPVTITFPNNVTDVDKAFIKMETNTASDLLITNAANKPTTMEGYGITDLISKDTAESKVNEIISTAKSRVGNHTAEEIAKVGYKLQVLNFANTDLEEMEMIFDYLEKENAALNAFASYPELETKGQVPR